ncbi:MAG: efflux RND transporter permease subunit [Deltaproteobacteria bacterium]|nr:efflux RND transporter permease subunit [Deltaproteobacteria bacterium]
MAGHSVAANLIMVVLLVGGILWGMNIKQEVFPDFDLDRVIISVPYPGASPEEVEQGILLALEEAVMDLEDVKEVQANASEGVGMVTVEVLTGGDLEKLAQDIQSEVDGITSFPEEAEEPRVAVAARRRQVISIALYGDQDERILREKAEEVRDRLLQDPRITQVDLSGIRNLEISIEVPQDNLRTYNLTIEEVARRLREASVELPGGGLKTDGGEILVRMKERRDYGREFARIPIITSNAGTVVRLEDIATINDGFEDTDRYAIYNGKPVVMIDVYRVGDQTPITVADAVREYVEELRNTLPPGIEVTTLRDFSEYYRQRLDLLLRNGYLGLILVLCLLGLFLEPRLAFWVTMGIPISFLGSLWFLPTLGISINMMSMFAFIVALGIVVDDAIVVGENVYKYRQDGYPFLKSAILGAREVALPVTFSILTNIVTFMPLMFVPGIPGKIFYAIPVVVITSIFISLMESLFVLPAHLGHLKTRKGRGLMGFFQRLQERFSNGFLRLIAKVYGPFLGLALRNRYVTLSIGIAILMLTLAWVKSGRMGMILFPRIESDFAYATAVLPYGSSVKRTEAVRDRLLKAAREIAAENGGDKLVKGITAQIGGGSGGGFGGPSGASGGHTCEIRVFLTPPDERPMRTFDFVRQWRRRVGLIPGVENLSLKHFAGGPGSRAALNIQVSHRDLNILEKASKDLATGLASFPSVKDIDDGFQPGKQQVDFKILPEGRSLGLRAQTVARQVRNAFYGAEVVRQQRGRNEMKVMVRLPEKERITEYGLEELMLRTPGGREVALREVVEMKRGRAYTTINRRNGRRVVNVRADVDPIKEASRIVASLKSDVLPQLGERYQGVKIEFVGRRADMQESMNSLGIGLLLAMAGVYALLAIPFRSYIQPAIIMSSIPFGIVGAVIGHILMDYNLSVMSFFGIVALTGVVVNDSLVLIDFTNRERRKGLNPMAALRSAGIRRFRPIMLTSLTTFGALIPMIFETSRQARFLIPMAISLGFGVLFATVIALLLVPALYLIVEDVRRLAGAGEMVHMDVGPGAGDAVEMPT